MKELCCTTSFLLLFAALWSVIYAQTDVGYPENLRQLHQNVMDQVLAGPETDQAVKATLANLNDQGYWTDIDYTSKERGGWPPANHLSRLLTLAQAYRTPSSTYYGDKELSAKLLRALDYWLENDLICPNWWYPEIGVPMRLAPTLFLMETELSTEQKEKAVKILDRAEIGMTGQNKVWLSGNVLMKSLLLGDEATIRKAADSIQEELRAGAGEGIQSDWSFHQHGPQLQFGNYGLSYAGSMIQWIGLLRGTPFAFEENKLSIVRNYLLDGLQWVSWKDRLDISSCGRQLFPDAPRQKAGSVARSLQEMETLDPPFAKTYAKAGQYATLTGNKHFWHSDYQVQRTPDYYFSVKMCSKRVVGAESCNSENIQGYYMGDGAAFLYQTGREYENIFPFWDWKKIPGTTTHQDAAPLPVLTCRGYRLESEFVGGVSNGKIGIAALDYTRNGLSAKKSWFMFEDIVICLGAGINSSEGHPVTTSINQALLNGQTVVKQDQRKNLEKGSRNLQNPRWIWHNYTGYFFPNGGKLKLENQSVTGSWQQVASRYPDEKMQADVFRLWLEHGTNPSGQSYAYYIFPNADIKDMEKIEARPPVQILQNSKEMQIVISSDEKTAGIVFYEPGKADVFGGVEVNEPCIVLLRKEKKGLQVSIADPTQKLEKIQVSLNGRYETAGDEGQTHVDGVRSRIAFDLPAGGDRGRTVTMTLKGQ